MFKNRLKQFCVLRQKRRLENKDSVFFRSGHGVFSPRRLTNLFLKVSSPTLKSSGSSIASTDLTNLDKSYAAFFSGRVFWGPWLPIVRSLHFDPAPLRGLFPQGRIVSALKTPQERLLRSFFTPYTFLFTIKAILSHKVE